MLCINLSASVNISYRNKGFTLLDMVLVVMILGILGMIVIPQFHSMVTEARLNEATGELVSGLQYAGSLAVQHQRPFGVKASVAGNWFRVFDDQYKADSNPHYDSDPPVDAYGVVLNPIDKKWYTKDFDTMKTYEGLKITSVPVGDEIYFYPDGHSSSSSDTTFVLTFGGEQRTVTVKWMTGRISVE
jgi:Tfp pilus assembly protein FimT